jgi:hypothetical protein
MFLLLIIRKLAIFMVMLR